MDLNLEERASQLKELGERKYNGNPISYFFEHIEIYRDLSRTGLSLVDPGLYKAISRAKQLDELPIPRLKIGRNTLSKEEVLIIINEYEPSGGVANRAAERLGYHPETIIKYWKKNGLKVEKKGGSLSKEQIKEIIAAHQIYGENISQAAKHLPYSFDTIRKYWLSNNLKIHRRGMPKRV